SGLVGADAANELDRAVFGHGHGLVGALTSHGFVIGGSHDGLARLGMDPCPDDDVEVRGTDDRHRGPADHPVTSATASAVASRSRMASRSLTELIAKITTFIATIGHDWMRALYATRTTAAPNET